MTHLMVINIAAETASYVDIKIESIDRDVLFEGSLQVTQDGYDLCEQDRGYLTPIKKFRGDDDLRRLASALTFLSARIKAQREAGKS